MRASKVSAVMVVVLGVGGAVDLVAGIVTGDTGHVIAGAWIVVAALLILLKPRQSRQDARGPGPRLSALMIGAATVAVVITLTFAAIRSPGTPTKALAVAGVVAALVLGAFSVKKLLAMAGTSGGDA
jgi:quinol-cytochrome oxidoreductase complex cytochrome b subunit